MKTKEKLLIPAHMQLICSCLMISNEHSWIIYMLCIHIEACSRNFKIKFWNSELCLMANLKNVKAC